jgi:hypothetical protein
LGALLALNLLALGWPWANLAQGQSPLETSLGQLKGEMEKSLEGARDQKMVSAVALRYASQAWALAAESQAHQAAPWSAEERLAQLGRIWENKGASWANRETVALRLFYEAIVALAVTQAAREPQTDWVLREVAGLIQLNSQIQKPQGHPVAREAEARLAWSNRLAAALPIVIRLKSQGSGEELTRLLDQLTSKAALIADRRDVHYQGRLELLFLNNAQATAKMSFLLAKSPGSPLIAEAEALEAAWLTQLQAPKIPVADQISLTWLSAAQLAFPLAFWLAGPP